MNLLHKQLFVSGQISVEDFAKLAESGIKTIINNRPDDEEANQLSQSDAQDLANQHGMQYHYLPMSNGQPLSPSLIDDFKAIIDNTDQAILAHCRSGMRSTILWALGQVSSGSLTPSEVISAASGAGIQLENYLPVFENAYPK